MTTMLRFAFLACAIAGSIGIGRLAAQSIPVAASGRSITIDATPVPLNPQAPSETAIGDFVYAGGVVLTSRDTGQLHGLSDIEVTGGDRLIAVTDFGNLLDARLVFDDAQRLVGLADARISTLSGEDGKPLVIKEEADAEGLAILPGGDRLVSFERRQRIWLYPANGGAPRPAPKPDVSFRSNSGMEALAADPDSGADAYIVGAEATGEVWSCRLSSPACVKAPSFAKPDEFSLVAMRRLPGMLSAYLLRAFDPRRGVRCSLLVFRGNELVARMDLAPPMTVDNFEGVAVVPRADGRFRFYLVSDDNAVVIQRTMLLAFDWQPRPVSAKQATDEEQIREARARSNAAIAAHDPSAVARQWMDDVHVVRSTGAQVNGRVRNQERMAQQFATRPDTIYVRQPSTIDVYGPWGMASERGEWTGRWTEPDGVVDTAGTYMAQWRRVDGRWLIQAEIYVPTRCSGSRYCSQRP